MRGHGYYLICVVCFFIHLSVISLAGADTQELVWKRVSNGIRDSDFKVVKVTPDNPNTVYVSSGNVVYKTGDGGKKWKEVLSFRGSGNIINTIAINPSSTETVYAGTKEGLYRSNDGGETWGRIFRGVGELENDVLAVAINPENINIEYIGTRAGLFISENNGSNWEKSRHSSVNDAVHFIAIDSSNPHIIYTATDKGVYKSLNSGVGWKSVFVTGSIRDKDNDNDNSNDNNERDDVYKNDSEEDDNDDKSDDESEANNKNKYDDSDDNESNYDGEDDIQRKNIAIDPVDNIIYVGTSEGIYISRDGGLTWEAHGRSGLHSLDIRHIISPAETDNLYTATARGVFEYSKISKNWKKIHKGLTSDDIRNLAFVPSVRDSGGTLWAATKKGAFKTMPVTGYASAGSIGTSTEEIHLKFVHEPSIEEILEAAIEYAEVSPEKIRVWRKAAATSAWLPKLEFEYKKANDWQNSTYFYSNSTEKYTDDDITSDRDSEWKVKVVWYLSDLIWNDDQTTIDSKSAAMVELRDDILNEVSRLYFERRRLQYEMVMAPPQDIREKIEKELRLQELTANIDALTGSYLSKRLKQGSGVAAQKKS